MCRRKCLQDRRTGACGNGTSLKLISVMTLDSGQPKVPLLHHCITASLHHPSRAWVGWMAWVSPKATVAAGSPLQLHYSQQDEARPSVATAKLSAVEESTFSGFNDAGVKHL